MEIGIGKKVKGEMGNERVLWKEKQETSVNEEEARN